MSKRLTPGRLPLRRRALFSLVTVTATGVVGLACLVAADLYAHARVQDVGGVNVWGYRGAPVGRKQAGEVRVVMLGGSTAFGWGQPAQDSIPAHLERRLRQDRRASRPVSVVNLGAPGQGAYSFRFDLADYAALDYDIVILYEGYNDLGRGEPANRDVPNVMAWRRQSPVFRLTGYFPILPVFIREKAIAMRHGGDLARAYPAGVVFQPSLPTRATAQAMTVAADVSDRLSNKIGRLSDAPVALQVDEHCVARWRQYCGAVREAVSWALDRQKRVIFVTQPYASDSHIEQQANVAAMLDSRFGSDPRLRITNLGRAVDLRDSDVAYDGLHLVSAGNDTIAAHLVDVVLELMP